jgi:proline dehydrogenase
MDRSDAPLDLEPAGTYSTEPPDVAHPSLKRRLGELASAAIMPSIKRAARPYLGGEMIGDALCVSARLKDEGFATALSYWDGGHESLADIQAIGLAAIAAVAPTSYLSLKPPALRFSQQTACALAVAAAPRGLRLHFDSHGAGVADRQNAMLEAMLEMLGPQHLGTTLPGRLQRSLRDADWAIGRGLNVRVVKGEWPDPDDPKPDLRAKFLDVIDRLAGRARHVAVATHDFALGREAIERLRAAGTSCEIEVLLGMPARSLLDWAKANAVTVRVYVPYGCGFIPNAVGVLRRNPRLALAIARAQLERITAKFLWRETRGQAALTERSKMTSQ